jgi:hypothetical protein
VISVDHSDMGGSELFAQEQILALFISLVEIEI